MPITDPKQQKTSEPPKSNAGAKSAVPLDNKSVGPLNKPIHDFAPPRWTSYLMWAEIAVKKVKQDLPYGAANNDLDGLHTAILAKHHKALGKPAPPDNRAELLKGFRTYLGKHVPAGTDPIEALMKRAQIARHFGVGNCHEQAAIAFEYLRDTGREKGHNLACVTYRSQVKDEQHVFVVIGLEQRPDKLGFTYGQIPDWGFNAVVCDPWAHEWFRVSHDWKRKGQRILRSISPANLQEGWDKIDVECLALVP